MTEHSYHGATSRWSVLWTFTIQIKMVKVVYHGLSPEVSIHSGDLVLIHLMHLGMDFVLGVHNIFLHQVLWNGVNPSLVEWFLKQIYNQRTNERIEWMNKWRKEGNVLFNDALNTFYLRLYGVTHMVKYHTDFIIWNPLLPHGLFPINIKGSFICTIPQTG